MLSTPDHGKAEFAGAAEGSWTANSPLSSDHPREGGLTRWGVPDGDWYAVDPEHARAVVLAQALEVDLLERTARLQARIVADLFGES